MQLQQFLNLVLRSAEVKFMKHNRWLESFVNRGTNSC